MKLENQVVSLELAEKLRELGVKQESAFYWATGAKNAFGSRKMYITPESMVPMRTNESIDVAAFTVAELLEILPEELHDEHEDLPYMLSLVKFGEYYIAHYQGDRGSMNGSEAKTAADALAGLLIYLLKNKLITL